MKRFCLLMLMVCLCGCEVARSADDYRDAAAVDLAISTMVDTPVPQPGPSPAKCFRCNGTGWITHGDGHKTPCPDCQEGSAGQYGGPLDTFRDAKALIAKGNALADRGKFLLDAAQREGKITLDVRLPKPTAIQSIKRPDTKLSCPGGSCPWGPDKPDVLKPTSDVTVATSDCSVGIWRPRLLRRLRR